MTAIAYPYDPTGTFSSNYINNEIATITVANAINAYLLIPDASPFYGDSMVVISPAGIPLNRDSDYVLSHYWSLASTNIGKAVYGSITLKEGYTVGRYRLVYRTIGGEYVSTPLNSIQSGICGGLDQYVNIDWSTAPTHFPSIPHNHELSGIAGMSQIYQALYDIAAAVVKKPSGISINDVYDAAFSNLTSSLDPIVTLMGSIGEINNTTDTAISALIEFLLPQMGLSKLPTTNKHYSIPYFGGIVFKVGQYDYAVGDEPTVIYFTDPIMTSLPLFTIGNISTLNVNDPPTLDKVYFGRPDLDKVSCTVIPNTTIPVTLTTPPLGSKPRRLITYFTIGFSK